MYLFNMVLCNHHEIFVRAARAGDSALALLNPGCCSASKFSRWKHLSRPERVGVRRLPQPLCRANPSGLRAILRQAQDRSFGKLRTGPFDRLRTRSFPGERASGPAQQHDAARNPVCREHRDTSSPAKHRACIRWQRYVPEAQRRFHSAANASPLRGSRRSGAISASGPSTHGCNRSGRGRVSAGSSRMQSPNSTRSASSV